jgi:hypothetical protein
VLKTSYKKETEGGIIYNVFVASSIMYKLAGHWTFGQLVPCDIIHQCGHVRIYSTSKIVKDRLTRWSRVLVEKVIAIQIVETFPVSYGIRRYNAVFTKARYWTIPEAR